MKKILPLLLVLGCAASAFAGDAERDILRAALNVATRSVNAHGAAPVVVASQTAGGAEAFAAQWILKRRGDVVGTSIANAYKSANAQPHSLTAVLPQAALIDLPDAQMDWDKVEAQHPGAKSVLVFSYPALDELGSVALVRADVFTKGTAPTTEFWDAEHQPDGSWKIGHGAIGTYASFHAAR